MKQFGKPYLDILQARVAEVERLQASRKISN
jgi:hypothetical protein